MQELWKEQIVLWDRNSCSLALQSGTDNHIPFQFTVPAQHKSSLADKMPACIAMPPNITDHRLSISYSIEVAVLRTTFNSKRLRLAPLSPAAYFFLNLVKALRYLSFISHYLYLHQCRLFNYKHIEQERVFQGREKIPWVGSLSRSWNIQPGFLMQKISN